jgi:carboxypeptidase Taq
MSEKYNKLHALSKSCAVYSTVQMLLEWDQETYMPEGAVALRSMQTEAIASLLHKQRTSAAFGNILGELINLETGHVKDHTLSAAQAAALREWRRDYLLAKKLPGSFVKKWATTTSEAMPAWGRARKNNSFKEFAPHLQKIVTLARKKADYLGFEKHPYDALLDCFEPRMTSAYLTPLFDGLKTSLTHLLKRIAAKPIPDAHFVTGHFPEGKQLDFAHVILKAMGFSNQTSRLDQSAHPFCTGMSPIDTRMTTHIHLDQLLPSIFAVIHEGGHGLYNNGLPFEHFGSPLAEQVSLGMDESQSRFWETIMGHSLPFWQHFYPQLQKEFPEKLSSVSLDAFHKAVNIVKPSFIRIHADEVTYSLHIIVRFEIEKALIEGSLKVKEIPEAWNEKMRAYLGIAPSTDALGCLQDIHWSMGAIGYFPTYTLGNLYAAQFFQTFVTTYPNWKERVAAGDLIFVREWLRENIHKWGKQFTADELCKRVSGKPLSEHPYVDYLEKKYQGLYHL